MSGSAAVAFDRVHGGVCGGEGVREGRHGQVSDIAATDRGANRQQAAAVGNRPAQGLIEGVEAGGAIRVGDDGGEFVSTEAGGDAVLVAPGGQPGGGGGEDGVPGGVPVGVVDAFEVVQVGNAWVRGFRERRDDEPTRLSALEAVSEAGSVRGIGGDRSWSRMMRE